MDPDSVRSYLRRYQQRSTLSDVNGVLQDGNPPPGSVRNQQSQLFKDADDHVIPTSDYEYRIWGQKEKLEKKSDFVYFEDEIGVVETAWDSLVAKAGMDSVSSYLPFHDDVATSGIYINQRGLRYLGHLLYYWSRVHAHRNSKSERTNALLTSQLAHDSQVFAGDPAFDQVEDALDLAREILVRYQWFHHQFELVVAHLEDARDEPLYQKYAQNHHQTPAERGRGLSAALALSMVRRSQACRSRAPNDLFLPLFERTIATIEWKNGSHNQFNSRRKFEDGCRELMVNLHGKELAARVPFETDVWSAVGSTISAYITRRESDSNNGSYANNEFPLGEKYKLEKSGTWKQQYSDADGSIRPQLDSVVDKLKDRATLPKLKGHGQGPNDTFYSDLTKSKRYVIKVDNANREITLLGFGDHDYPKEYGLHVN